MKYFAYGSNMNPRRLLRRVQFEGKPEKAVLNGFRLRFNKIDYSTVGAGYANITRKSDGIVEGVLFDVPDEFMPVLDVYEGVPFHYIRKPMTVQTESGSERAEVYVAVKRATGFKLRPKKQYWFHLAVGAKIFLSEDYYKQILRVKCI